MAVVSAAAKKPHEVYADWVRKLGEEAAAREDRSQWTDAVMSLRDQEVIGLLREIRDTLQGRRGFVVVPSTDECWRYGRQQP